MNILAGGKLKYGILLCAFLSCALVGFGAEKALLAKTLFLPADSRATLLTVNERGYYSLRAKSKTGTAIEVIDRMAGVIGPLSGAPGERDGRIDLLLEPGEYRVNVHPDRNAKTPAELEVLPFREVNAGGSLAELPFLENDSDLATTLGDRETRSYWIYLPARAEVRIEAAGRTLTACALWQNGQWLMPPAASQTVLEPVKGRPLFSVEFHQVLEAGHYLLVCVGGQPRVWAEDNAALPFYIRRGFRYLGMNSTQRLTISPFGRDAYLIAGSANYIECARETRAQTTVSVGGFTEGRSRYATSTRASITKDSKEPWCALSAGYGDKQWLVLEAKPGDVIEVSFFRTAGNGTSFPVKRTSASYWVSAIASQAGRDLLDLTPIVYYRKDKHITFLKDGAVRVTPRDPLIRRVNLLSPTTLYVYIEEKGSYRLAEALSADKTGAKGRYRFVLLENEFLGSSGTPDYQTPDKPFELVKAYYKLDIQPLSAGILHFACYRDGAQRPDELLKRTPPPTGHSFTWSGITIPAMESASLTVNSRRNVNLGLEIRELPLSLAEPLSAYLKPGESVEIPISLSEESILSIDGGKYSLTDAGRELRAESVLAPGRRTLTLKNNGADLELFTLSTADRRSRERFPAPVLKAFDEIFPVFTGDAPYFADFDRGQTRNILLRVKEPALYRIETQGRLALSLGVRTPIVPTLFWAVENGTGRNALVSSYLRPGDYLVSVSARGQSRGRAGVALKKTPLTDEGALPVGVLSRKTVPADIGLRYRLAVETAGRYGMYTHGLAIKYPYRLEDNDGFPLTAPGTSGTTIDLEPGAYAFYSLPMPFVTRRLTRFTALRDEAAAPAGKRTILTINSTRENVWRETPDRSPDMYAFTLPAPLTITLAFSKGLEGTLTGKSLPEAMRLAGGQDLTLELETGAYELTVRPQEVQNLFTYSVSLSTAMLAAGLTYEVPESGGEWIVSAGGDRVYDFWTFGSDDFQASLWDETGKRLIAENDDMESDWNFRITQRLAAGRYRLRLEPAGHVAGPAALFMDTNTEESLPEQPLPFVVERTLGREILQFPVRPAAEGVLLVKAETGRAVKIGLYRSGALIAEGEDFLAVPLARNKSYTLHLFQRDDSPQRVKVTVNLSSPAETTLSAQSTTVDITSLLSIRNPTGLSFRFADPENLLLFAPALEQPCLPLAGAWLATKGERGYLVVKTLALRKGVRVETLTLASGRPEAVFLANAPHSFLCETGRDELALLTAETQGAGPGLSLLPRNAFQPGRFDFRGMDSAGATTSLLAPAGGPFQGKVWSTAATLSGRSAERVELLLRSIPAARDSLRPGDNRTFTLLPGRGLRVELAAGAQEIRALLARGCVTALWNNDRPEGAAVAPETENREVRIHATGGVFLVVNPGSAPALVRIAIVPVSGPSLTTLDPAGFEAVFTEAGTLRLRVPHPPAGTSHTVLYAAGEGFQARLFSATGAVHDASGGPIVVLPAEDGDLEIVHGRGFVRIGFAESGREADAFAARAPGLRATPLEKNVALKGGTNLYSFNLPQDGFVELTADAPGLIALYGGGRVLDVSAGADTVSPRRIIRRLPKGAYEVLSRSLAGAPQNGSLSLSRLPLFDIATADPQMEYFIGRDETHVFRFTVAVSGMVGVGLSVEDDDLEAELINANAERLGEGALIFRPLEKGIYYYVVRGTMKPVRYTPRLFGHEGSDAGVPKEIVDQYQPKEGEE